MTIPNRLARAGQMLRQGISDDLIMQETDLTLAQIDVVRENQSTPPSLEEKLAEGEFEHALMDWVNEE